MKKIVITTFIMPNEIDDLERILMDLNKASKYVKGDNYELYLALTVSDFLVDWDNSKLDKQYFIDRFNKKCENTEILRNRISELEEFSRKVKDGEKSFDDLKILFRSAVTRGLDIFFNPIFNITNFLI